MRKRQRRFIEHYFRDFNARQAAIRAGYDERNAATQGWRLLRQKAVAAAVAERAEAEMRGLRREADRIVLEFMRIAFSDMRHYLVADEAGRLALAESASLAPGDSAAVQKVGGGGGAGFIRLHDKARALHALGKRVELFERRDHVDPAELVAERNRVREKLFRMAGLQQDAEGNWLLNGEPLLPPEEEG